MSFFYFFFNNHDHWPWPWPWPLRELALASNSSGLGLYVVWPWPWPRTCCPRTHPSVVGRRTCDLGVAGSRPGRDDAAQQPRQVVYTRLPLSPSSIMFTSQLRWEVNIQQAYRVVHQSVSRCLAVFADAWLSVGLRRSAPTYGKR